MRPLPYLPMYIYVHAGPGAALRHGLPPLTIHILSSLRKMVGAARQRGQPECHSAYGSLLLASAQALMLHTGMARAHPHVSPSLLV